uniref:Uncharacterized protein n=1 Tax=Arundo donax TaxID=35708 RepID=A0A0A9B465_ARUDO
MTLALPCTTCSGRSVLCLPPAAAAAAA